MDRNAMSIFIGYMICSKKYCRIIFLVGYKFLSTYLLSIAIFKSHEKFH
jgi:hypothetical protein